MKNKKTPVNAWEPALWAIICGSSTVTTVNTISESTITPDWLKAILIAFTASIAIGSAYETYQSVSKLNRYIKKLENRQK